jgi:hypothetical protein
MLGKARMAHLELAKPARAFVAELAGAARCR